MKRDNRPLGTFERAVISGEVFEDLDKAEAREAAELTEREEQEWVAERKSGCTHYSACPTAWWWSGKVREMACQDCGEINYIDED